jgi:predicted acyltransferase
MSEPNVTLTPDNRLLSLDFFRGFTMLLLVGEFTGLFSNLTNPAFNSPFLHAIGTQFHHHVWHGLHFWDLIQPFFMFIVGVAMPFSFAKRTARGDSYELLRKHALQRSFLLLLIGWALYCIVPGEIKFHFQNVLAQLSVTYFITFLVIRQKVSVQLIVSFGLLILTEIIYRTFWVEGFNHPFTPDENFGTWLDLLYGGENLSGHWVSFNAIPTTAHTIWGAMAGMLLMSDKPAMKKVQILAIAGLAGVIVGYGLDPVTPIIKRIATTSFVIVSGGWALLVLAFSYWLIDIKKSRKWVIIFSVVGMNPLFIYLFAHLDGVPFLRAIIYPFTQAAFSWTGNLVTDMIQNVILWFMLWYITYWMYKRKIFIRI